MTRPEENPDETWFKAPNVTPVSGTEAFDGLDAKVQDFWQFAMSDLRMNNVRGYLAEFLVARAIGAASVRVEWDAYDVLAPDGTRIEVKSSAYVQAWDQKRLSRIVFTGLTGRTWTPQHGEAPLATFNADIYVFAVQTSQTHEAYNPLDVSQWMFYVLPRQTLEDTGYKSISLSTLERISDGAVKYAGLKDAIDASR